MGGKPSGSGDWAPGEHVGFFILFFSTRKSGRREGMEGILSAIRRGVPSWRLSAPPWEREGAVGPPRVMEEEKGGRESWEGREAEKPAWVPCVKQGEWGAKGAISKNSGCILGALTAEEIGAGRSRAGRTGGAVVPSSRKEARRSRQGPGPGPPRPPHRQILTWPSPSRLPLALHTWGLGGECDSGGGCFPLLPCKCVKESGLG